MTYRMASHCPFVVWATLVAHMVVSSMVLAANESPSADKKEPAFTLSRMLALVEENHGELIALRKEVERLRLRWKETQRLWGPRISLTGTSFESKGALGFGFGGFGSFGGLSGGMTTRTEAWELQQTGSQQPLPPTIFKGVALTGQISAILYSGGQLEASQEQAFWAYQMAMANYEQRKSELFLDVINATLTVLHSEDMLEVAHRAVNSLKELERITRKRVDAGASARIELLRVQAQLAEAEVGRLSRENELEVARSFLRSLMGLPADAPIRLREFMPEIPIVKPEYDVASLRQEARRQRPEMRLAEARIALARAQRRMAAAGYKPAIQISGSRSWFDSNSLSEDTSWGVFLGFSWPVFDNSVTRLRMAQVREDIEAAQSRREQIERQIDVEIDRSLTAWVTAYHAWEAAQRGLEAARENLRLSRLRYETGFSTHIEILDAESTLSEAEARFQQSIYDFMSAKAALWKAVGRSLISVL